MGGSRERRLGFSRSSRPSRVRCPTTAICQFRLGSASRAWASLSSGTRMFPTRLRSAAIWLRPKLSISSTMLAQSGATGRPARKSRSAAACDIAQAWVSLS